MASDNFIVSWNIADGGKTCNALKNRTINALERYNHKMNEKLPTPRPTFSGFVLKIEKARDQVKRLENIMLGN